MKLLNIILALLMIPSLSWSKIPDEDDILDRTLDSSSPYYYPSLMMRYNNLDTLTEEDYHYLYYGYTYQDSYKPLATNRAVDMLYESLMGLDPDAVTDEEMREVISICKEAMKVDPFNPTVLNMMVFAYGALGDKQKEEAYFRHLNGILETIKSSGDGRSEKYPMHIIMFSHAVDVVASMDRNKPDDVTFKRKRTWQFNNLKPREYK